MTKDVLVSVRGAHIADGETNNLEVITAGSYYFKNGKHYIIYDEILEGEEGSIRNTIKANADSVDMIKGGAGAYDFSGEPSECQLLCDSIRSDDRGRHDRPHQDQ